MNKSKKIPEYLHKKVVNIPLYEGKLVVVLTNSSEQLLNNSLDVKSDEPFAHAMFVNWKGYQGFVVVLNFEKPKGSRITHGIIAHEALHIVNFIADVKGFIPTLENDEPMTYLIEWVVDEIYKTMKKFNKKIEL